MFKMIQKLFHQKKKHKSKWKIYAIKITQNNYWHKVVAEEKPDTFEKSIIGPWRSEVDCEEFCDRVNETHAEKIVALYKPRPSPLRKFN